MSNFKPDDVSALLTGLTEAQLRAVKWDDGPLLLIAGPGSGKTRVLTSRIARLLMESPDDSFRVLALTFTNHAADQMRSRILSLVPNSEDRLFIGTFHSFCVDFLRKNAKFAGISGNFSIYSSNEDRNEIVSEAVQESLSEEEKFDVDAKKALTAIDYCKSNLISPSDCLGSFKDKRRGEIFQKVYFKYEEILKGLNALDFNSLLFYSIKIIKDRPHLAKRLRSTYKYWCLDEFQDTNKAQFSLIEAMASDSFNNIFLVADDDQIIYQWNGASYRRLEEFSEKFHPDKLQLPTNFRCSPEIVNLANMLVSKNNFRTPGKHPLISGKDSTTPDMPIRLLHFGDEEEEAVGVVDDIASRHESRDSVVVLARTRAILDQIQKAALRKGIPARVIQRRDDFQSSLFQFLVFCLKLSIARGDVRVLEKLLTPFNKLFDFDLALDSIKLKAESSHGDYFRAWLEEGLQTANSEHAREVLAKVRDKLLKGDSYKEFCEFYLNWLDRFTSEHESNDPLKAKQFEIDEDRAAWNEIWREVHQAVGSDCTTDMFLQELELRSKEPPLEKNGVALMTIHASKGSEFDHVYLCGLAEDILPSYFSKKGGDQSPQMEEERRNCFVAITRARSSLTLSFADRYRGWRKQPSRFLFEMELID